MTATAHDDTTHASGKTLSAARATIAAGLACGAAGGGLMIGVLALRAILAGVAPWAPLAVFGSALLTAETHAGQAGAALLGLAIHATFSAFFGVAYGVLRGRRGDPRFIARLTWGFAAALGAMVLMTFAVVPAVDPDLYAGIQRDWTTWVIAHLAFGTGLAWYPVARSTIA